MEKEQEKEHPIWREASEKLPPTVVTVVIKDTDGTIYTDSANRWHSEVTDYEWLDTTKGVLLSKEEHDAFIQLAKCAAEVNEYLSNETYEKGKPVHLNNIGAFSKLHKDMIAALCQLKQTEK